MKYFLAFILSFVVCCVQAQTSYLAYQVSGNVSYFENDKSLPLKLGKVLTAPKTVSVAKDSKLILVCNTSYRAITLQPGTYEIDKFSDLCNKNETSEISRYLKYVWWQFTAPHATADEERKKMMQDGGAVFRGCPGIEFSSVYDTVCYYRENVTLQWQTTGDYAKKELMVYDGANSITPLVTIKPGKDSYRLDNLRSKLKPSREYFWSVSINGEDACSSRVIQVWSKTNFDRFCDSLRKNFTIAIDKAERNYMMGYFLEINHFYGEAYKYYAAALVAKPSDMRYKTTVARCGAIVGKK
jgi:hypothetical protein